MPRPQSVDKSAPTQEVATAKVAVKDLNDTVVLPDFFSKEVWRFKLIGSQPVIFKIGNDVSHKAYNPRTKKFENIRYCDNQSSIWVNEQEGVVSKGQVYFQDGILDASKQEATLLEFIFRHRDYGSQFSLVDPEGDALRELAEMKVSQEAVSKAWDTKFVILKQLALALGQPHDSEPTCRKAMVDYATANSQDFLDMFDDPIVEIVANINRGLQGSLLIIGDNGLKWHDGGRIIVIPTGVSDPIAYAAGVLVEPTEKNIAILEELKRKLK
jgi:hypothetical protein